MRKLKLLLVLCMVTIAASASKTVYLKPSVNWLADSPRFALYMFTGTETGVWTDFAAVTDADGIYSAEFNDSYESMIICRMDPAVTDNNWDRKWNQSNDLTAPAASGLLYTFAEGWDNPSVTISIYGATAASFADGGKYIFKNVGSGRYLGPSNDWGTQASLILASVYNTVHAVNGKYTIESQVANNSDANHWFSGGYMDSGSGDAKQLTISMLSNGNYVMADGASYYGYNGSSTVLNAALTDFNAANAQWEIISTDDAIANASESNPVDASFLIANPNFDRNHRSGTGVWTNPQGLGLAGGDRTNFCVEAYEKTFNLSQTINNVPNGYYKVRAQAAVTMHNARTVVPYDATACPVIYATSGSATVTTPFKEMAQGDQLSSQTQIGNAFLAGNYVTEYSEILTVTDKSITIGAKSDYSNIWGVFDTFMLQYLGPIDLSGYATALAEAVTAAQATQGTIPTAAYNKIADVVGEYNQTYTTEEEYTTAISAINDAVSAYASDNIVAAYARYNRIKAAVLAINADIDVSDADAAANAATTNTAVDAAVPTLRNALTTAIASIESQDIDLTDALIDNPAPGTAGKLDYWTTNQGTGYGNNLYEFYNKEDASTRQTIQATMPAGYYKLTVVGYTREGQTACMFVDKGSDNVANKLLVGVDKATVNNLSQGSDWIADGNGVNEMTFNLEAAAENNFTIGIWGGDEGDKWTAWRSFKLEFLGTDPLVLFQNQLAEKATAANAHATELGETIPAGAMNTYTTAISTAAAKNTTKEECLQSIQDIEDATAAADACVAPYAAYKTLITDVQALYDVTAYEELTAGSHDALGTALTTAADAVAAATDATAIEEVTTTLKDAGATYAGAANPTGDAQFNLTFLLNNPDVTKFWDGTWWIVPTGWASEQNDGNKQVMQNNNTTNGDHKVYFEYWSDPAKKNGLFNLYTSVTLPEGTYNMSCWAFAQDQGNPAANGAGVYFYANETQGSQVTSNKLTEQHIEFVNDAKQEVKIGLKPTTGNTYNWMGIGYVKLYKVPAKSYTIDETAAWDATTEGAGDVTLNRTIKANVNTLVLPFSMTQAEVEETFGTGSKVYVLKSYNETTDNLSFTTNQGIVANKPCLLKATDAGTSYTIEGRTIVANEQPKDVVTGASMIGTYAASITVPEGSYIFSNGKYYNVDSEVTLKNTRAYIQLDETTSAGARTLTVSFDGGETTGIATLENGELKVETGVIYDLSGRVVKNPAKGIYVINGKKVVK